MIASDRVQANTAPGVNERIEHDARLRVLNSASDPKGNLTRRIQALDREWDIERWLEMNASALAFTGTVLGLVWNRRFFAIPCLVLPFLFQHAVQGWCPPIPILRRKGTRTRNEIDEEKFALKALRGDFDDLNENHPLGRAEKAWSAATR